MDLAGDGVKHHACVFRQVAHDVAAGLAYLHPTVVHRDLKPHNVLLEGGRAGRAKVPPASTPAVHAK